MITNPFPESKLIWTALLSGGSGAAIATGLFNLYGKSWLENRFARSLEEAKSELLVLSTRRLKLHDKEFEVFPLIWNSLNQAVSSLDVAVISFRMIPNFYKLKDAALDEWLNNSGLSASERKYFTEQSDKGKAYGEILDRRDVAKAIEDFASFHKLLLNNRIFLSPDIKHKLDKIDSSIRSSLTSKRMDFEGYSNSKKFLLESVDILTNKVKPLMEEIELLVQAKLFPER